MKAEIHSNFTKKQLFRNSWKLFWTKILLIWMNFLKFTEIQILFYRLKWRWTIWVSQQWIEAFCKIISCTARVVFFRTGNQRCNSKHQKHYCLNRKSSSHDSTKEPVRTSNNALIIFGSVPVIYNPDIISCICISIKSLL